jgi:hypothetical protein
MQIGLGQITIGEARAAGLTKLEGDRAALDRYRTLLKGA